MTPRLGSITCDGHPVLTSFLAGYRNHVGFAPPVATLRRRLDSEIGRDDLLRVVRALGTHAWRLEQAGDAIALIAVLDDVAYASQREFGVLDETQRATSEIFSAASEVAVTSELSHEAARIDMNHALLFLRRVRPNMEELRMAKRLLNNAARLAKGLPRHDRTSRSIEYGKQVIQLLRVTEARSSVAESGRIEKTLLDILKFLKLFVEDLDKSDPVMVTGVLARAAMALDHILDLRRESIERSIVLKHGHELGLVRLSSLDEMGGPSSVLQTLRSVSSIFGLARTPSWVPASEIIRARVQASAQRDLSWLVEFLSDLDEILGNIIPLSSDAELTIVQTLWKGTGEVRFLERLITLYEVVDFKASNLLESGLSLMQLCYEHGLDLSVTLLEKLTDAVPPNPSLGSPVDVDRMHLACSLVRAGLLQKAKVTVAGVSFLPPNSIHVMYDLFGTVLFGTGGSGDLVCMEVEVDAKQLVALIYSSELDNPGLHEANDVLQSVTIVLDILKPVASALAKLLEKNSPVHLIIEGQYRQLPIASVLEDSYSGRYPSISVIASGGNRSEPEWRYCSVVDESENPREAPLPMGKLEVVEVERLLAKCRWIDSDARIRKISGTSRSEFEEILQQGGVMHFTGHSHIWIDSIDGTILSLTGRSISAQDVTHLNASRTGLVFMNSCRSGRDPALPSMRLTSMSRALVLAGCQMVVGTLWPVKDTPALIFAMKFYEMTAPFERIDLVRTYMAIRETQQWMKNVSDSDLLDFSTRHQFQISTPADELHSPRHWAAYYVCSPMIT